MSAFKRTLLVTAALAVLPLIHGCATLAGYTEKPKVTLSSFRLTDFSLLEQGFKLRLRVFNPNARELPVKSMNFTIDINGKRFAEGYSNETVIVPPNDSSLVEVTAHSDIVGVWKQLRAQGKTDADKLNYKIYGTIVAGGFDVKIPFEQIGVFE